MNMKNNKHPCRASHQWENSERAAEHVTPSIHFRRMNRCPKCGADKEGYEFLVMDDQPSERTARPEELIKHGFHVPTKQR